jgi:glycosyltransferase involved in cell wall biosynthesis
MQIKIGCEASKTEVIPNGINLLRFANLPQKEVSDTNINIGAVVRMTPIKDIKTLINSFHIARMKKPDMMLYIIGNTDEDPDYYNECVGLVELLDVKNLIFTGHVNVDEYVGRMDIIILTSLSEGQPLSILEAMASGKPCITTNVGDCFDMLKAGDIQNRAGLIARVMNVNELAEAMLTLATNANLRMQMGENGKIIAAEKYNLVDMINKYDDVYKKVHEKGSYADGENRNRATEGV